MPEDLKHTIDIAVSDIKDNPWEGRAGFIDEMFTAFLETHGDDIEADYENSTKTGFESFGENVRMFLAALVERLDGPISEVRCAEQAMTYALSLRPDHLQAALDWQNANPDQKTAVNQLITALPGYAAVILTINEQVPAAYDALDASRTAQ